MSLIEKIYKSRKTVIHMLKDRGIDVSSLNNYTQKEIEILYNTVKLKNNKDINGIDILIEKPQKVIAKYIFNNKIRISNIMSIVDEFIEDQLNDSDILILILNTKTINSQDSLENYFNKIYETKKIFCQFFLIDRITYNITDHILVPRHSIIPKK